MPARRDLILLASAAVGLLSAWHLGDDRKGPAISAVRERASLRVSQRWYGARDAFPRVPPARQPIPSGAAALGGWFVAHPDAGARGLARHGEAYPGQAVAIGWKLAEAPTALDEACQALPKGGLRDSVLAGAALALADREPERAAAVAARIEGGRTQRNTLETIAYSWMTSDPVSAESWISRTRDAALRQALIATSAKAIAASDPDLAAEWLIAGDEPAVLAADATARASRNGALELVRERLKESGASGADIWLTRLAPRQPAAQ